MSVLHSNDYQSTAPWEQEELPTLRMKEDKPRVTQLALAAPVPVPEPMRAKPGVSWFMSQFLVGCAVVASSLLFYVLVSHYVVVPVSVKADAAAPAATRQYIHRWHYFFSPPQRGDSVVVQDSESRTPVARKIVARPSDCLTLKEGKVTINGHVVEATALVALVASDRSGAKSKLIQLGRDQYVVCEVRDDEAAGGFWMVRRQDILGPIMH